MAKVHGGPCPVTLPAEEVRGKNSGEEHEEAEAKSARLGRGLKDLGLLRARLPSASGLRSKGTGSLAGAATSDDRNAEGLGGLAHGAGPRSARPPLRAGYKSIKKSQDKANWVHEADGKGWAGTKPRARCWGHV